MFDEMYCVFHHNLYCKSGPVAILGQTSLITSVHACTVVWIGQIFQELCIVSTAVHINQVDHLKQYYLVSFYNHNK